MTTRGRIALYSDEVNSEDWKAIKAWLKKNKINFHEHQVESVPVRFGR